MSDRKTLLHLIPGAQVGGCEVNCLRVVQGTPEFSHRILVFDGPGAMSPLWEAAGAPAQHLDAWRSLAKFRSALARWAKDTPRPDAIIYWSSSRLPVVLTALSQWDLPWAVHLGNPLVPGWSQNLRRRFEEARRAPQAQVTLVACSRYVAESHRESPYFRNFPIEVVYNPVDPSLDRIRRHRLLPKGSSPRVGMVARLDQIKDHLTLIRALALASAVRPDLVVEFAGDGAQRAELEREASRLDVASRVHFLGFQSVGPLLETWDIYVHSTTRGEGMGTAVAEAMLSGLPCIVTDLPAMREVCGPEAAIYTPEADAQFMAQGILRLIQDRSWRSSLGNLAQSRARSMFGLLETSAAYAALLFSASAPPPP